MAQLQSTCPVCDAAVTIAENAEESEIINCPDCKSRLVVGKVDQGKVTLTQAPTVEEDWGE